MFLYFLAVKTKEGIGSFFLRHYKKRQKKINYVATLGSERLQILFKHFSETSKGSRVTE